MEKRKIKNIKMYIFYKKKPHVKKNNFLKKNRIVKQYFS